jgi:hypothetical protein
VLCISSALIPKRNYTPTTAYPANFFEIEEILDVFTIIFTYHIRLHFIRKTRSVVRQISGTQATEEAVRESGKLDLVLAAKPVVHS